ncbi:hypothetical protein ACHAPZ_010034 [Fusarium culmorum]
MPVSISSPVLLGGKSYLLELLFLCVFYGTRQTFDTVKEEGPSNSKVLHLLDNNIGLEAVYERLSETLQRLGIDEARHFPIIRLYAVDGEVGSGVKRDAQKGPTGRLDRTAAEAELNSFADEFMLEATLTRISVDTQDTQEALRNAKHRHNEGSLCSGAFNYFEDNTDEFTQLHELVNKVKDGQELDTAEFGNFKAWIKNLFEAYLLQFNGVVLSTTNKTSSGARAVRGGGIFEAAVVETSTMRELTTMIPIAFFNHKAIITGDVNQRAPFIILEHDLESGISSNPFAEQLTISLLMRMNAGAPESYLKVNQTSGYQKNWPLRP